MVLTTQRQETRLVMKQRVWVELDVVYRRWDLGLARAPQGGSPSDRKSYWDKITGSAYLTRSEDGSERLGGEV